MTDAVLDRLVLLEAENVHLAEQARDGRSAVDNLQAALEAVEAERKAKEEAESLYRGALKLLYMLSFVLIAGSRCSNPDSAADGRRDRTPLGSGRAEEGSSFAR